MALKIELKPYERFIIGNSVVITDRRVCLTILGNLPVLREKDILRAEQAVTPATRIYFAVQSLVLENNLASEQDEILKETRLLLARHPSAASVVASMTAHIAAGEHYKALKDAKRLRELEEHHTEALGAA